MLLAPLDASPPIDRNDCPCGMFVVSATGRKGKSGSLDHSIVLRLKDSTALRSPLFFQSKSGLKQIVMSRWVQ